MKWISLSKPDFTSNRIYVIDNTDGLLFGLTTLLNAYVIGAMKHLHYDIHDTLEMFNDDKCQDLILSWNVCKRLWYDHIENAPKDISSGLHVETLKYICHMLLNVNMRRHEKVVINDHPVYLNNLNIMETFNKYEDPIIVYAFLLTDNKSSSYNFGNYVLVFDNKYLDSITSKWVPVISGLQFAKSASSKVQNITKYLSGMKYMIFTLQFRSTPKKYCKFLRKRIKLLQDHDYHDEDNERVIISKEMIERRKMIQKRKRTDSETDNESS